MLVCVSEFSSRLNNERNKFNKPQKKKKSIREKNSTPHRLFASEFQVDFHFSHTTHSGLICFFFTIIICFYFLYDPALDIIQKQVI